MFISFEGIDGSGKSTQARLLADTLRAEGHEVVPTREPGGSAGAEQIRRLLVEGSADRWSAETELLLFAAARRDHLERTIRPALDRGAVVITDRFADSSRVYQGATRGDLRDAVDMIHRLMIGIEPDVTFVIDLDPAEALARAAQRTETLAGPGRKGTAAGASAPALVSSQNSEERFESMGLLFQTRLQQGFRTLAASDPGRIRLIDGAGDPAQVAARVRAAL